MSKTSIKSSIEPCLSVDGGYDRHLTTDDPTLWRMSQYRHPVLAEHATIWAVLARLEQDSGASVQEKDAALRALVSEYGNRPHAFWAAALLKAFRPGLIALAVAHRAATGSELAVAEHEVASAFLHCAQALVLSDVHLSVATTLLMRTRSALRTTLRAERRRRRRFLPMEESTPAAERREATADALALLDEVVRRALTDEERAALLVEVGRVTGLSVTEALSAVGEPVTPETLPARRKAHERVLKRLRAGFDR